VDQVDLPVAQRQGALTARESSRDFGRSPGGNDIKLFLFAIDAAEKFASLFFSAEFFQDCLILKSKVTSLSKVLNLSKRRSYLQFQTGLKKLAKEKHFCIIFRSDDDK
jgi:hypothetical protein